MLWLIGIASVWVFVCGMVIALCVMARRGDEALTSVPPRVEEPEVGFVATLAPTPEPVAQSPAAPRPAPHTSVR